MTARLAATLLLITALHATVAMAGTAAPGNPSTVESEMNGEVDTLRKQIDWYREELGRLQKAKAKYTASIASNEAQLEENKAEEQRIREEIQQLQQEILRGAGASREVTE